MKFLWSIITFSIVFHQMHFSKSEFSLKELLSPKSPSINLRRFNVFPVHNHKKLSMGKGEKNKQTYVENLKLKLEKLELEREKEFELEREKELKLKREKELKLEREREMMRERELELKRQNFNMLIQNNSKLSFLRDFYSPRNF